MAVKLVLDTSVLLTYAAYNRLQRLAIAALTYDLIYYANDQVIDEFRRNLPKVKKVNIIPDPAIFNGIDVLLTLVGVEPTFAMSPDPKDNFLFDIAIQTGAAYIVTSEKALLKFKDSPVPIMDIKWFKETFPVSL